LNTIRELRFIPNQVDAFLKEVEACIVAGAKRIALYPSSTLAKELMTVIVADHQNVEVTLQEAFSDIAGGEGRDEADVILLCHEDSEELSCALMDCLNLERGIVVAPITKRYFKNIPLFLISIPKAGTHLLYKLAEAFGYTAGVELGSIAKGGTWYCVEYSNSHTSARDFFVDTVRRSPFGNRHHPFMRSPALFIYRNPLDILVSEANYYHKDGNTAFAGYLGHLSFEERLDKLIDDPWLFGSCVDRIGQFAPWLEMPNVIPLSFEELIGSGGGGDRAIQENIIWSLQLKLSVPGYPGAFADQVFDSRSPTFFKASIGSSRSCFPASLFQKFRNCDPDRSLMRVFGYEKADLEYFVGIPDRAEEFRMRPVVLSNRSFDDVPICHKYDYLGCNIIQFRGVFYGVPGSLGAVNIAGLSEEDGLWNSIFCAGSLEGCERKILIGHYEATPQLVEEGFQGFNIVYADGVFYGVHQSLGEVDFSAVDKLLEKYSLGQFIAGRSLEAVRTQITTVSESLNS